MKAAFLRTILLLPLVAAAAPPWFQVGVDRAERPEAYVGIEASELLQRDFTDIGPDNWTLLAGMRFWQPGLDRFGLRLVTLDVELSPKHLQDSSNVKFIEGNRMDLAGGLGAHRLYWDWYPGRLQVGHIRAWNRYALTVRPVVGAGIGYTNWRFKNTKYDESYDLRAMSLGFGARLGIELFDVVFIDNPMLDFAFLVAKNRSVAAVLGDTRITRPEWWSLFSWLGVGVKVRL
jgi:hypothetical protein